MDPGPVSHRPGGTPGNQGDTAQRAPDPHHRRKQPDGPRGGAAVPAGGAVLMSSLWAKKRDDGIRSYHPLLYHMLDVAAVAGLVWDYWLPSRLCERIKSSIGCYEERPLIMFLAGAHDIGKAIPGFQARIHEPCATISLPISTQCQNRPHGLVTAYVLNGFLNATPSATMLGQISGGHHGVFPRSDSLHMGRDTLGQKAWDNIRADQLNQLADLVGFNTNSVDQINHSLSDPAIIPLLAGFISYD